MYRECTSGKWCHGGAFLGFGGVLKPGGGGLTLLPTESPGHRPALLGQIGLHSHVADEPRCCLEGRDLAESTQDGLESRDFGQDI